MVKSEANALFDVFYTENARRVARYTALVARMHKMPMALVPDLKQAAFLEAALALRYWKADGGKTMFNWCAGPMRRGILRAYRASCGSRPYGTDALPHWQPYKSKYNSTPTPAIEETIDLHRALATDPKPKQIMRLIMIALSVSNGAEIARESGIGKQTVSEHLSKARARLRVVLSA